MPSCYCLNHVGIQYHNLDFPMIQIGACLENVQPKQEITEFNSLWTLVILWQDIQDQKIKKIHTQTIICLGGKSTMNFVGKEILHLQYMNSFKQPNNNPFTVENIK